MLGFLTAAERAEGAGFGGAAASSMLFICLKAGAAGRRRKESPELEERLKKVSVVSRSTSELENQAAELRRLWVLGEEGRVLLGGREREERRRLPLFSLEVLLMEDSATSGRVLKWQEEKEEGKILEIFCINLWFSILMYFLHFSKWFGWGWILYRGERERAKRERESMSTKL